MVQKSYGCTTPFGTKTPMRLRPQRQGVGYPPTGQLGRHGVTRRVRIVVGEGRTAQQGLLRFVLEGEGFDVVGEAKGVADLSGEIEANQPDVVVLDDGIGVVAVSMVHEVAPQAKIVLVWPSAVVPIGGDARVEPAKILRDLGPAVEHVMAPIAALTETFERPSMDRQGAQRSRCPARLARCQGDHEAPQRHPPATPEQATPPHGSAATGGRRKVPRGTGPRTGRDAPRRHRRGSSRASAGHRRRLSRLTTSSRNRSRSGRSGTGASACSPSAAPRP